MQYKDVEGEKIWNQHVVSNTDSYGSGICRYARRWAELMEGRMEQGETLLGCAKDTSHKADIDGVTGFMYGCAVNILSQVWIHGEKLRKWHNLDCQIGNEGEKANEGKGVLNPAIMTLGDKE